MTKATDYDEEGENPPKPNLSAAPKDQGVCQHLNLLLYAN